MKYEREELEKMSKNDLVETYRNARRGEKRKILINLANSYKFSDLVNGLNFIELMQMAKIHPFKEVVLDTIIHEIELGNVEITEKLKQKYSPQRNVDKVAGLKFGDSIMDVLKRGNVLDRIKAFFTQKTALPDTFVKKMEKVKKLSKIATRKNDATGKKVEQLENVPLDQPSEQSRVEVNNGEMAKIFDAFAKEALKNGELVGPRRTTPVGEQLKSDLAEEYTRILGAEKEDVAKLIAMKEYESYSGEMFFMPYSDGNFGAKHYGEKTVISGPKDNRGWQKNLLEVEQVEDFTVQGHNFGEVFIVKSEFSPTDRAIKGKWAPIYEYYTKNEKGEMVRIGSGKINAQTGKMETTMTLDGSDWQEIFKVSGSKDCDLNEEFVLAKEQGTIMIFDSNEYTGKSTKTSRKDIEEAITSKAIQEYLNKINSGKKVQIVDITQVKDLQQDNSERVRYGTTDWQTVSKPTTNVYLINSVVDGRETCELVTIDVDGKCKPFLEMKKDMFSDKKISFTTGLMPIAGGKVAKGAPQLLTEKTALEKFKSKDGVEYAVYRDDSGKLRMGQLVEFADGSGTYVEEIDTYSVMHGDAEKVKKEQSQGKEQEQSKNPKGKEEEAER